MEDVKSVSVKPKSIWGVVWFVLVALPMPLCLLSYHLLLWLMEQMAIISLSMKQLARSGIIGLGAQAILATLITGLLWKFTQDERFKPMYASMFGAALMSLPALGLRLLSPNDDQLGALIQLALSLLGAGAILLLRKGKIQWKAESLPFGLLVGGAGLLPYLLFGSFGSLWDVALTLLASLSFGILSALLLKSSTGSVWLDGLGIGATLALLGSALGYDGSQLLLLITLPAFAFAVTSLMPSRTAAGAGVSLLTFGALSLFDSTEFTLVLEDVGLAALKTAGYVLAAGILASLLGLGLRRGAESLAGGRTKRAVAWTGNAALWLFLAGAYFLLGHHGSYGDRLFVIMKEQADLSSVANIENRNERLTAAYKILTTHAQETQTPLRETLQKAGIAYTPYYLENALEVRGGLFVKWYLQSRADVERVIPSPRLRYAPPTLPQPGEQTSPAEAVGWNIHMIGADKVWAEFGARGQGIVIGQSDSGVDANHPALQIQYRGFKSGDDYNWYDPWEGTSTPNDENGHGTHTLGTMLGAGGIGVAPQAQWIGCVNLNRNLANPALYLECMQFMLAPFPQGGDPLKDGDPTRAAHVMNNSWGCPPLEGCDPQALFYAAENLRAAGIFVTVSAGNDGPNCETVAAPLALYDSVFSVGAIDQFGQMADFSSRGPVTADGSARAKPEIVAPGVDILSSLPNGTYGTNSGTSMAGPHVTGAVALLWSAQPKLIGDIEATEQLLIETAQPYSGNESLGCFGNEIPSPAYGYGVIDVYAAVKKALGH